MKQCINTLFRFKLVPRDLAKGLIGTSSNFRGFSSLPFGTNPDHTVQGGVREKIMISLSKKVINREDSWAYQKSAPDTFHANTPLHQLIWHLDLVKAYPMGHGEERGNE